MERKGFGMRIAFTGHKLVGKTTCAEALRIEFGGLVVDMMKPLRLGVISAVAKMGLTVPLKHFYEEKTEESRKLLQAIGNYARSLDREILVKYACTVIDLAQPDVSFFIENMRMKYEEEAFRSRGFTIVRVVRPGFDGDSDVTETEMDSIEADFTWHNTGSLRDLKEAAVAFARGFKGD